ncbi:heterokaryon incompatibility protein Het-C-domain-containing protein [Xylogone sp. PMI_703]|nr:heterokaryon incompatibility protein Het-C-domain-containing protein [Xylogone sp. PMI_703]
MGRYNPTFTSLFLAICVLLLVLPAPAAAFGAGNIPSIAEIEGKNFRHGDIEDLLKTIAFIKGQKWTSMNIKRVYFGNWLRDYSQAVDVGSLKGVSAPTIRILVWVLSFLSFGYATGEYEVTEERLGVYRPEEHIDNPKDYADNIDARTFDPRLRGPVQPRELEVDMNTGMKNYIANDAGGWATSTGYIRFSFQRSIHFGRVYTSGASGASGKEADLCEALRCLGQGLHCMEDFGAHTNYCELALRELGYHEVFPHVGTATEINVRGKRIYPLVTGTFGAVDFLHSVLGEATDHFAQTEVEEMDIALKNAEQSQNSGQRGFGAQNFMGLLGQVPGLGGGLADTARSLQAQAADQEHRNAMTRDNPQTSFNAPPGSVGGPPGPGIPGMSPDLDPVKVAKQIYPILEFRDRVVKAISATIAKIPGLEALVEKISETLTLFILSLLAPYVRPIIDAVSKSLKQGSSSVVEASANSQFEPWNDPHSTNPTHSMLSKDHFSNFLNGCAGKVATSILQYVAPRIIYAWENPGVPIDEVLNDILRAFHHPALRDERIEIHRNMFNTVRRWAEEHPERASINHVLSSASVKAGRNHKGGVHDDQSHGSLFGGHGKTSGSLWSEIQSRDLNSLEGRDGNPQSISPMPQTQGSNYGYHSGPPRPESSGGPGAYPGSYSAPHQYGGAPAPNYQQPPYQQPYGGYQNYPAAGAPGQMPPQQWNAPQQPPYGGSAPYPSSYNQHPPPPGHGGYQQGPPYGQQPPYGGGYGY